MRGCEDAQCFPAATEQAIDETGSTLPSILLTVDHNDQKRIGEQVGVKTTWDRAACQRLYGRMT